jgi:hypothetical protein
MDIVRFIQPANLEAEKSKFLGSGRYLPRFIYRWDEPEYRVWAEETTQYGDLVKALISQDTGEMVGQASRVFATQMDIVLLRKSQEEAEQAIVPIPKASLAEVVLAQQQALDMLGIDYEVVVTSDKGFNFRPEHASKKLVVSNDLQLDLFSLSGEVRHEMTHIVRYVNGKVNGIRRSALYLPTEEGLATYLQDYGGDEPNNSLKQHAAEYAVTEVMLNGSLRDGYEYLRSLGFSERLAWQRAARHKFGWRDTGKPGDIMKPSMYYYWSEKIAELGLAERLRLMVGKISLAELGKYEEYKGKIPREDLESVFHFA